MIEKIFCKDYASAMEEIFRRINNRTREIGVKNYLILPDSYTLYAEKRLCDSEGGYFDINVVSFNRLFFLLCDKKPLGKAQAVMLIRSILSDSTLECFVRSSKYRGFADKIYDTIILLKKNGITPEKLLRSASANSKFKDIALIYERYLERSAEYADSSSRIRLLKAAIEENGFFKGANIFATNFDLVTEDERELLDCIAKSADNFVFAYCLPTSSSDEITDDISVMECSGSAEQLKEVALKIADAAYNGVSYEDMCVICAGECRNHVQRIFGEYAVPYCLDYKYRFSDHPLPRYILSLLNAVRRGLRRKDVFELVKNPYFGVEKSDADAFSLFCEMFCIDYKGFETTFEDRESEYTEVAEGVRKRLLREVASARRLGRYSVPTSAFYKFICDKVKDVWETGKAFDGEIGIDSTAELIAVADFITALTDKADIDLLTEIFEDGVDAVEIATLPALSGSVAIGDVSAFRGQRFRYMFLLDFNEGVLPRRSEESGIISDYDIVSSNLKLITATESNIRHRSELLMLLSSADKIFITYDKNSAAGKSMLLKSLIVKKSIIPFCRNDELNVLYNDASILPLLAGVKPAAEELLLGAVSEYSLFGDYRGNVRDFAFPLYTALGEGIEKYFLFGDDHTLDKANAVKLFSTSVLSVSRISGFYKCPYMHFLKYGLNLKPIEKGEVGANDVGDVLHKVAERFVREYKGGNIETFVEGMTKEIINLHYKKGLMKNPATYGFLLDEAVRGCKILASHFAAGEFSPMGEEISFGYPRSPLKSVKIDMGGEKVPLCGKIDYADLWKNYARVIDYKTGGNSFDIKNYYYGTDIQLAIYSYVLNLNGFNPAGIFIFPFRIAWDTEEKNLNFVGLFDVELLNKFDRGFDDGEHVSDVINARNTLKSNGEIKFSSSSATTNARLVSLGKYAFNLTERAAHLMSEGFIESKPFKSGNRMPCLYCDYISVCRYGGNNGYRILRNKRLEDFTEDRNDDLDE